MKIVIKAENTSVRSKSVAQVLALVAKRFIGDGHRLVITHGDSEPPAFHLNRNNGTKAAVHGAGCPIEGRDTALEMLYGNPTIALRAAFKMAGLMAIRLSGADGNVFCVRREPTSMIAEIVAADPFWLEVISAKGGIPLLDNLALGPGEEYCWINADQVASACATAWDADALIILAEADRLQEQNGTVIRWLPTDKISDLLATCAIPPHVSSELNACCHALKHGVRRARIFPISQLDSLSSFYFSRIDCGTEVILLEPGTGVPLSSRQANSARI